MKKILYIALLAVGLLFTSCKKESLQSYLVDRQEKKEFKHLSIPASILQLGSLTLSEEEKEAYKSIQKVNLTGLLKNDATEGQYETEKETLKRIFKNSEYKSLMSFKNNGVNATLYYTGEKDAIDEIIAFGYGEDFGVGVARVLGDNMNPNAILKMLRKTQLDTNAINLSEFKMIFDEVNK